MPPKKSPIIRVKEPPKNIKKTHVSTWMITINTNNRDGDEDALIACRDTVFSEQYLLDHLSDLIKITSKTDTGNVGLEDVIESVDIDPGPIEYKKTGAHSPHIHVSLTITHTSLLQLNYENIRKAIADASGYTNWYVGFNRHKDYRYTTRNYANKTAIAES